LSASGEYQQGIKHLERAVNIFINKYGKTHPKVAAAWNNMGLAWHGLKEYQRAVDLYKKALKIYEKELGPDHPETKKVRENLEETEKKLKGKDREQGKPCPPSS
jgi:tetratricopeptide (TPR) repeat protein